MNKIAESAF